MELRASYPSHEWQKRKIAGNQYSIIEAFLPYLDPLSDDEVRSYFVEQWGFSAQLASAVNQWRPRVNEEVKPKVRAAGR